MKKEIRFRLIKHLTFLEPELRDFEVFQNLSWKEYHEDRGKRRNVERWIENITNSSINIAKLILTSAGYNIPDTNKDIVKNLSLITYYSEQLNIYTYSPQPPPVVGSYRLSPCVGRGLR